MTTIYRSKLIQYLLLLLFLHCGVMTTVNAQNLSTLQYQGSAKGIKSKATRSIEELPDGQFKLTNQVRNWLGKVTEQTIFHYDKNNHIVPLSYDYRLRSTFVKRHHHINFDWSKMQASETYKKKTKIIDLQLGYLDPLSFQQQLQNDLRAGQTNLNYKVIKRFSIRDYNYVVEKEEPLTIAENSYQTLKVNRQFSVDSKRQLSLWVAPDLDYLMVKMQQMEKDKPSFLIEIDR